MSKKNTGIWKLWLDLHGRSLPNCGSLLAFFIHQNYSSGIATYPCMPMCMCICKYCAGKIYILVLAIALTCTVIASFHLHFSRKKNAHTCLSVLFLSFWYGLSSICFIEHGKNISGKISDYIKSFNIL